jgi:hypothetical protein
MAASGEDLGSFSSEIHAVMLEFMRVRLQVRRPVVFAAQRVLPIRPTGKRLRRWG